MTRFPGRSCFLLLSLALAACGSSGGGTPDAGNVLPDSGVPDSGVPDGGAGAFSIGGLVTDVGTGTGVAGAQVTGGGKSTTTDAQGQFTLEALPAGDVQLTVAKSGYAPGYATGKSSGAPGPVLVTLKKQGALNTYDPRTALTLSERTEAGPYALLLEADTLDTSETSLTIAITPVDPTKESQALPGSLVSGGSTPGVLLPVTFAEFTLLDSTGRRINLKSSASATVELPIPPSLRATYPAGTKIHCYAYDPSTGKWEDFVEGTVRTSSVDSVTPVLAAAIRHFSWYGAAPQGNDCADVYVSVVSAVDGKPLPNARVEASPGTAAYTDLSGSARVIAAIGNGSSTYTAYQTGFDVDGSLTGMPGAKYIEFGKVEEELVGLVPRPCSGAPLTASTGSAALRGSQGEPLVIKVGVVTNLLYRATAVIASTGGGSVTVVLEAGVPGPDGDLTNPLPASGAKITIAEPGGTPVALVELSAGTGAYFLSGGLAITPGKTYTLSIDADGNGSIDGTGRAVAVGDLAWTSPLDGSTVSAAGLTASWTDTGTAQAAAGYAPVYVVSLFSSTSGDAASYIGTERQFSALSVSTGAALSPGTYVGSLLGFGGAFGQTGASVQVSNNITGAGVTGLFYSLGSASTITFTLQ